MERNSAVMFRIHYLTSGIKQSAGSKRLIISLKKGGGLAGKNTECLRVDRTVRQSEGLGV